MKQPAFQRTSVLSAFLICLFACMAVLCMTATEAFAVPSELSLKSGQVSDSVYEQSWTGDECVLASSSNTKVAKVILNEIDDQTTSVRVIGLYPGSAIVTVGWYTEGYDDQSPEMLDEYQIKVTVSSAGAIRTGQCDGLYKGVNYTKSTLFSDYDFREYYYGGSINGVYKPWFPGKASLLLASGSYSSASSDGKYVKFTNTGTCTVNAKYNSKTYKITVGKVHSGAATRDAFQKKVKATAKAKGYTYKYVAAKVYNSKGLGYKAVAVKYTLTKGSKTITRTGSAWFEDGQFKYDVSKVI